MSTALKEVQRCTKNDKFKTVPCCCPDCENNTDYTQKGVVVTDNDMVTEEIRQWVGFTFKCPACRKDSIIDFVKFCPECGVKVIIRSHKVTAFITQLEAGRKQ